jgi:hypothetical protein
MPVGAPPGSPNPNDPTQQQKNVPVGSLLPKGPPKEPKATPETTAMRQRQTNVLKKRQDLEQHQGSVGAPKDADMGTYGFFPPTMPIA